MKNLGIKTWFVVNVQNGVYVLLSKCLMRETGFSLFSLLVHARNHSTRGGENFGLLPKNGNINLLSIDQNVHDATCIIIARGIFIQFLLVIPSDVFLLSTNTAISILSLRFSCFPFKIAILNNNLFFQTSMLALLLGCSAALVASSYDGS